MIPRLFRRFRRRVATSPQTVAVQPVRSALWACIGLLWGPVALVAALLAVTSTDASGSSGVSAAWVLSLSPPLLIAIVWILSGLSGATALLIRIDRLLSAAPGQPMPRPWLFAAAHMAGSWLAGALAFVVSQRVGIDIWELFASVICASFVGATFIERMAERYIHHSPPGASPAPPPER